VDLDDLLPPRDEDASDEDDVFEVWPEHWDAVRLFQACDDQWTVLVSWGGSFYQGIDFAKVTAVAEWIGVAKTEALFWQMRQMIAEAKLVLNG
jgi:hypothetical protein